MRFTTGLMLLISAIFFAACSNGPTAVQTSRVRPVESPTPEYKPPKRVSRDVISTDVKSERPTVAKKTK